MNRRKDVLAPDGSLPRWQSGPAIAGAMLGAAVVGAQHVAGTAARDAFFLTHFDPSALPPMIIGSSVASIALVAAASRGLRRISPATYVPAAFVASAALLAAEWALSSVGPGLTAQIVYVQISSLGPMLGSGFWLLVSERFDPRTAKRHFGRIAGAGTTGGLIGSLLAARVAAVAGVAAMLPLLAALSMVAAWQVRSFARSEVQALAGDDTSDRPPNRQSGLRVLAESPYLRSLAALVLLGTMGSIFVDYVFKVHAKNTFGEGPALAGFFSLYYAAANLITFLLQAFASRTVMERLGPGLAAGLPSLALAAGSVATLVAPGLRGAVLTRGSEAICRGSLFRSAYELFYTPLPPAEKRVVKPILDVGFDRSGDIIGAAIIQVLLRLALTSHLVVLLWLAIASSLAVLVVASRVTRGYVRTLEQSLLARAVEIDLSEVEDTTTRTTVLRVLARSGTARATVPPVEVDQDVGDIAALRSRDVERVRRVLLNPAGPAPSLVPHVIALLAWGPVATDAVQALRRVAEERVGELTDALLDPNQPFAVRRRLARVFSVCVSQRAADGLLLGLEDLRFEVRFHCARSLAAIVERNPHVRLDRERVLGVVRREVAVSRPVWEGRRLLDGDPGEGRTFLEELLRDRASQSLAHVFALLSLVLPAEPLHVAFRGVHTNDRLLRGTALEYLHAVLPPDVREPLWPFLEAEAAAPRAARAPDEIVADLLRSNESITLNLRELNRP